jgi:hypothetical protein
MIFTVARFVLDGLDPPLVNEPLPVPTPAWPWAGCRRPDLAIVNNPRRPAESRGAAAMDRIRRACSAAFPKGVPDDERLESRQR